MDLSYSLHLKELPDLSNATNLEKLVLHHCESLVELHSSISNLPKLKQLWMFFCTKLEVIPTKWNLSSLELVNFTGCSQLSNIPRISSPNIQSIDISATSIDVPPPIVYWSHLRSLSMRFNKNLRTLNLPANMNMLDLSNSGIETLCFNTGDKLEELKLTNCKNLKSLQQLPGSLKVLDAADCESLEKVDWVAIHPKAKLKFTNCIKLDQQTQKTIIQGRPFIFRTSCLPGSEIPTRFNHQSNGNTLTLPFSASSRFEVCLVISSNQTSRGHLESPQVFGRRKGEGYKDTIHKKLWNINNETSHLFIFNGGSLSKEACEVGGEIVYEFSSNFSIKKCGAQIETIVPLVGDLNPNRAEPFTDDDIKHYRLICYFSCIGSLVGLLFLLFGLC